MIKWIRHLRLPVSLTCGRISHLVGNLNFVPKIDHFVTILPHYSLCKMSKNGNTSPLFKILFFKNIWIYLRLIVVALFKSKIAVYSGYREWDILLAFQTFDLRLRTWLTVAEDVILGFDAFYRWFGAEVTARKDFSLPFVAFYRWFCACGVTVGANLLLPFSCFRTLVTVEADILIL